jgi:hypothetical protein
MTMLATHKFRLVASGVCFAAASLLHAQSILSVQYPGGLPLAHATGPSLAIGGAGSGVQNDFFGMADNVANLGCLNRSVFSAVTSFDFISVKQGNAASTFAALSPRLFSFAFPLNPVGAFGFSFDQRTTMRYRFITDTLITTGSGLSVTDSLGDVVEGGIKSWQAGWGRAIGRWAFVGASYERLYLSSIDITLYSAGLGGGQPRYDSVSFLFRGNALRAGILVPMAKLTVGMTGEYVFTGHAERTVGSTDSTMKGTQTFPLSLPPSLSLGASYAFSPSWLAAVSSGITLWKKYHSPYPLGGDVDNALSLAAGLQFIPAPHLLMPRYWEIMQYRLGFRYCELPVVTGSEIAFDVSIGLPLLKGGGLVDCIAEYGRRSDSRFPNNSENFLRLFIGINGGRKWYRSTGTRY